LLPELDPGAEVEVVSQLSALALLKQELAQLQAAAEEVQADPSTNKKSKKKKNPSLPASGQQQRLATLSRYIGTWADVARKLEDKVPSAAQQESSHFARMPPELVCEVLSFLDYGKHHRTRDRAHAHTTAHAAHTRVMANWARA
jgi:hypothetical protein